MHDLVFMQVAQGQHYLGSYVFNSGLREPLDLIQIVVDVPSRHVLQEKVDPQVILKNILHRVYKGVICLEKNLFFDFDVLDLLFLEDHVLVEALHSVHLFRLIVLHQKHFAEATLVNDLLNCEVLELDVVAVGGILTDH